MTWQTVAIIAGVFLIGFLLGRGFGGGGGNAPAPPPPVPRLATRPASPRSGPQSGPHRVHLRDAGRNKIAVIKVLRELTGLGLKETKDLADGAPVVVLTGLSRAAAEHAVEALRQAGGEADLG